MRRDLTLLSRKLLFSRRATNFRLLALLFYVIKIGKYKEALEFAISNEKHLPEWNRTAILTQQSANFRKIRFHTNRP